MNYSMDNKIWRVGGPLFAYFGINFMVKLFFHLGLFYAKFKELNVNAAFNGVLYANQLNEDKMVYSVLISGLSAMISIPILIMLMKKDYEYPVNRRHKERSFDIRLHARKMDMSMFLVLAFIGIFATLGLSRLILMLPIDGILGNYSEVKEAYEAGNVWIQLLMLGIVVPVSEELLFRGLVYKRLKLYYDVSIAAYISALIFGIAHFNLLQGLYAFIMGIVFSFVYEKLNSIYAPMIIHVVANLVAVLSSISPITEWIESHVLIKLIVAIIETGMFIQIFVMFYKKKDRKNKEEQMLQELRKHKTQEEIHKMDFHI